MRTLRAIYPVIQPERQFKRESFAVWAGIYKQCELHLIICRPWVLKLWSHLRDAAKAGISSWPGSPTCQTKSTGGLLSPLSYTRRLAAAPGTPWTSRGKPRILPRTQLHALTCMLQDCLAVGYKHGKQSALATSTLRSACCALASAAHVLVEKLSSSSEALQCTI